MNSTSYLSNMQNLLAPFKPFICKPRMIPWPPSKVGWRDARSRGAWVDWLVRWAKQGNNRWRYQFLSYNVPLTTVD
jgi:hypothetical protein